MEKTTRRIQNQATPVEHLDAFLCRGADKLQRTIGIGNAMSMRQLLGRSSQSGRWRTFLRVRAQGTYHSTQLTTRFCLESA